MKVATSLGLLALISTLTVIPAVLHGRILNRWGVNTAMLQASQSLLELPEEYGDFVKISEQEPLTERVQKELGVTEHIRGQYRNRKGQQVQLLLMAGQPGPMVRHPPDICYAMSGNRQRGEPKLWKLSGGEPANQFKVLTYDTSSTLTPSFTVAYGFFDGEAWDCPDAPRLKYGGKQWLWKLQVLCDEPAKKGSLIPEPTQAFLSALVAASFKVPTD